MSSGPQPWQRVPALLAARVVGNEESPLQSRDHVLHRTTLTFGGADHPANPPGLCLLTAALIALESRAVGCEVGVELLTLGQQHRPEMFGLKAIRGFGRLASRVHFAR
jgi:hypothetical protein